MLRVLRLRIALICWAVLFAAVIALAHVENGIVYYTDINGSGVTRVSSEIAGNMTGPIWSPNGSQLLYLATGEVHQGHDYGDVLVRIVRLTDMTARQLELPPELRGARAPAWCPDGTRIAFVGTAASALQTGQNDIYLMDLSDGKTTNFTNGSVPFIGMPVWSPDGDRIAFTAGVDPWSLHIIGVDGESAAARVFSLDAFLFNLSWSPDGTRFAAQCKLGGKNHEICVLNVDDSGMFNVSNHPSFDGDPAWSPDGKEIAFVSDRDGDLEIYRMGADGSTVTRVTDSIGADVEPAWSPDGGKICFLSDRQVPAWEAIVRWVQWRWRE